MSLLAMIMETASEIYYLFLSVAGTGNFPQRLTGAEEAECIKRLESGDITARSELIEHNLRLVAHICRKYYSSGGDQDDMLSIGTIGLIKAVDSFSTDKGTRFSSYAARCIENECLMSLRAAKKSAQDVSISEPIDTDKHGNELTLLDVISCEDTIADDVDSKLRRERLREIVPRLLEGRELEIISKRYGLYGKEPQTQREIAAELKISRSYVSRIEKRALEKLQSEFETG